MYICFKLLYYPPPPGNHSQLTFYSNQMQQWIIMTTNEATMNEIIWTHFFILKPPFRGL